MAIRKINYFLNKSPHVVFSVIMIFILSDLFINIINTNYEILKNEF